MKTNESGSVLEALGSFFRSQRIARGLTLQEVSSNWSAATLSRFERGEIDISTDKMLSLMTKIGIDELDFLEFYESIPANFPLQLQDLTQLNDIAILEARKRGFFAAHPHINSMTELARLMFAAAENWPNPQFRFSSEDEQLLTDRLATPERFTILELELYKAIAGPASHELLSLLWHRAQRIPDNWRQPREMIELLLWLGALMDQDMELVNDMESELAEWYVADSVRDRIIEFMSNWQYGRSVANWLRTPTNQNKAKIQAIISILKKYDVMTDARWFEMMLVRTQSGSVYHNTQLIDHPRKLTEAHTAQEVVKRQRLYLGLKITDINLNVSPTTLRRFENGQTQLAASSLFQLCGELALLPSQILSSLDPTSDNVLGKISLKQTFKQVQQATALNEDKHLVTNLIHQFTTQFSDIPANTLNMQLFVLKSASGLVPANDPTMLRQAPILLSRLLQNNHWGALETHTSQELVNWLNPEQLTMLFQKGNHVVVKHPLTVGINYVFSGLNQAIIRVILHYSSKELSAFLQSFRWLLTSTDPSPERWEALGSWYLGRYLLDPSKANADQVELYVHESLRIGHPNAITNLKSFNIKHLPKGFIDKFVSSYKD